MPLPTRKHVQKQEAAHDTFPMPNSNRTNSGSVLVRLKLRAWWAHAIPALVHRPDPIRFANDRHPSCLHVQYLPVRIPIPH